MAISSNSDLKRSSASFAARASIAISFAGLWIWLVAGIRLHEMIVGGCVVAVATIFLLTVRETVQCALDLRWEDVAQGWRVPWYIATGIWEITVVFLKDLLNIQRAGSFYRVCGFRSSKRDSRIIAREVLATVYTTTAPNFIVIGIDPELSRMLFHQIERSRIPKMTRALGAK
jgi:hypothetical protein